MDLNPIIQETVAVSVVFDSAYTDAAPKVEILLNEQSFYNEILPNGNHSIDFTVTLDANKIHKLTVNRTGKEPGQDQITKIADVIIDSISVRDIVWHRSLYYADYPEPWASEQKAAGIELAQLNAETSLAKTGVGLNLERIENSIATAEADAEFNNRVMTANMKSFVSQTERNIKDILLQKQVADLNVRESTMIRPERLSYDPRPELPPERVFIERMEAIPGFVPQAAQQNVWAPLIQGIVKGGSSLIGVDFT